MRSSDVFTILFTSLATTLSTAEEAITCVVTVASYMLTTEEWAPTSSIICTSVINDILTSYDEHSPPFPVEASLSSALGTSSLVLPSATDYISTTLYHHNIHRQNHSASYAAWDANIARYAAIVASSCVYAHNL
jgi:hypothetical protein